MSCGLGCRRGSDLALLRLWRRPAAVALIRPLAWEPPYAAGAALEKAKRQKEEGEKNVRRARATNQKGTLMFPNCAPKKAYSLRQSKSNEGLDGCGKEWDSVK